MEELIRDPLFILAVISIMVAIVVPATIFLLERKRKSLGYEILANTSLLTLDEEIKGKIKILYEDIPIQNVYLLILDVFNDGNVDIEESDFISPLTFKFGENTQILSNEVIKTDPDNLNPEFNVSTNEIELIPLHIIRKESFQIKLLLTQFEGKIKVEARIKGITEVKQRSRKKQKSLITLLFWYLVLLVTFVIVGLPFLYSSSTNSNPTGDNISGYLHGFFTALAIGFIFLQMEKHSQTIKELFRKK